MLKSIAGALFVALWSPLALAQTPTPEPVSSATPEPEVTPLPATPSPTPALEKKAKGRPAPEISGALQIIYKERFDKDGDDEVEPSLFRIQRVKIRIEGELTERVSYQVQIDPRSPLIENVLRDAYVDYDLLPGGAIDQKIRAGQMRTPFGYENWASSSDLYTPNRTEVSELHGRGITNRDIGVGLIGDVPLGGGFRLENAMSITNGAGMGAQADDDNKKNYFGKLNGRYKNKDRDLTVWLGGSAGMGTLNEEGIPGVPTDPGEHVEFKRVGADLEVDHTYAFFVAEGARGWEKNANDPALDPEAGSTEVLDAWFVLLAVKSPWKIGERRVGVVGRYDVFGVYDETPEYIRTTVGLWWGEPKLGKADGKRPLGEELRLIATYETVTEDGEPKDDRAILWAQVEF